MTTQWPNPLSKLRKVNVPGGFLLNNLKDIQLPPDPPSFQSTALLYLKFFGDNPTYAKADGDPPISENITAWDEPKAFSEEGIFRLRGYYDHFVAWTRIRGRVPTGTLNVASWDQIPPDSSHLPDNDEDPIDGWQQYDTPGGARYFTRRLPYLRVSSQELDVPSPNTNPVRCACIVDRGQFGKYILVCTFVDEATDQIHSIKWDEVSLGVWELIGTVNYPALDPEISTDDPRPWKASFNASGTQMVTPCSISIPTTDDQGLPLRIALVDISHDIVEPLPGFPEASFSLTTSLDVTHTFTFSRVDDDTTTETLTGDDFDGTADYVTTDLTTRTFKNLFDVDFDGDSLEYIWVEGEQTQSFNSTSSATWSSTVEDTSTGSSTRVTSSQFKVFSSLWEKHQKLVNLQQGQADTGEEGFLMDETLTHTETLTGAFPPIDDSVVSDLDGQLFCSGVACPCVEFADASTGVVAIDYSYYERDTQIVYTDVQPGTLGTYTYIVEYQYSTDETNMRKRFMSRPVPPNYRNREDINSSRLVAAITSELNPEQMVTIEDQGYVYVPAGSYPSLSSSSVSEPPHPTGFIPGSTTIPFSNTQTDTEISAVKDYYPNKVAVDFSEGAWFRNFTLSKTGGSPDFKAPESPPSDLQDIHAILSSLAPGKEPFYSVEDIYGNVALLIKSGTWFRISASLGDLTTSQRLFINGVEQTDPFLSGYLTTREYDELSGSFSAPPSQLLEFVTNPVGFLHTLKRYC